jgi:hypothetical protein
MVFWDVHDADKAIGIELRDERYARLVIEVADPEAEIRRITQAAAGGHADQCPDRSAATHPNARPPQRTTPGQSSGEPGRCRHVPCELTSPYW